MKRFKQAVAILLMTSTLAAMAGCSFTSDQTNNTEVTTQATYLIGSPGKSEEFEFGVTGINSFDVTTDYGETMHYLLVSVSYTNLSDKEQDELGLNYDRIVHGISVNYKEKADNGQ